MVSMIVSPEQHWNRVYATKDSTQVSWHEPRPDTSLRLIGDQAHSGRVLDVGAGQSTLVDLLVERGYDVTILDVSSEAIEAVKARVPGRPSLRFVVTDLLAWRPDDSYDVWHDRAAFHFFTEAPDQRTYVDLAASAVRPGGAVVLGTFAPDGPDQCSGLPTARHDAAGIAKLFSKRFDLILEEREEHTTPWGTLQPFTRVVLRRSAH